MGHGTGRGGHPTIGPQTTGGVGGPATPAVLGPAVWIYDLPLSFGHGLPDTDDVLPTFDGDGVPFWFSPTLFADLAEASQVREWPGVMAPLDLLYLAVRVDLANLVDDGGRIIVTVDGVDTAVLITIPAGATADVTLEASGLVAVATTSKIGARWDPGLANQGGFLRCEIRVRGRWSGVAATPIVTPLVGAFWMKANSGIVRTGTVVTRINDLDPLQQDLTVTSPGDEPEYVASAVNGKPGIRFNKPAGSGGPDGIGILTNLLRQTGPDVEFASGDPRTIWAVIVPEIWNEGASSGIGGGICAFRNEAVLQTIMALDAFDWDNDNRFYVYRNGSFDRTAPNVAGFGPTKPWMIRWEYDGTNLAVYVDGVLQVLNSAVANPADASVNPGFILGRAGAIGEGHNGHQIIQEFRVFDGIQSAADIAQYTAELTAEWGPF